MKLRQKVGYVGLTLGAANTRQFYNEAGFD